MHGTEVRNLLHPFLLLLVREHPGHGYDLINRLALLGVAEVEPGHVYRVLRHLEREKLLASAWVASAAGPARRRYELTAEGLADLEAWMTRLAQLHDVAGACLERWAEASGSPPPGPVTSARSSLHVSGREAPWPSWRESRPHPRRAVLP